MTLPLRKKLLSPTEGPRPPRRPIPVPAPAEPESPWTEAKARAILASWPILGWRPRRSACRKRCAGG